MAEREDFHPSHDLYLDHERGMDPHTPMWACRVCQEAECALCKLEPDSDLAAPCTGFPWYESVTVQVGDGETITARQSGTGWV